MTPRFEPGAVQATIDPVEDETVPTPLRQTLQIGAVKAQPCLTIIAGGDIGFVHRLEGAIVVLGRSEHADIRLTVDGVSRKHAEIRRDENGDLTIVDLHSTNGVWVEGRRVHTHLLHDGERIQLGANTVLQYGLQSEEQEEIQRRLYESATRDALTGAFNRRVFDEHLARELSHARRHAQAVSLLVIDVDHFKRINDHHGHAAGDHVLRQLGQLIADSTRTEDIFCRIGGEEFAVLTRDPGPEGPHQFAERLRQLVERHYFAFEGERLPITICIGLATHAPEYPTPDALLGAADEALYEAKGSGRNKVCVAE